MKIRKSLLFGAALSLCLGAAVFASETTETETGAVTLDSQRAAEDAQAISEEAQAVSEAAETESMATGITIGFLTYNPEDSQNMAFRKYLEEYVGLAFGASFYYSDACNTEEEEHAFVEELHNRGVRGMIGTPQYMSTMDLCAEYGIYFVFAAGSASDEEYVQLKDNEYFLGTISSSKEEEETAGKNMAQNFAVEDTEKTKHYLILSGGASLGNEMHELRTVGMLEGLSEAYGISYEKTAEELAVAEETVDVETGCDVQITILPGYPVVTPLSENVESTAAEKGSDVVLSVVSADYVIDGVRAVESDTEKDIKVGAVDCFTDSAYELFNGVYNGGKQELDYLVGYYGAGVAPAFVALANACSGYAEDFRDNGEPFQLIQNFWTAADQDTFNEFYSLSVGISENAYSAENMMKVLKDYNPDATFADYKSFVEQPNTLE